MDTDDPPPSPYGFKSHIPTRLSTPEMAEWKYEMRREAQEVIPGLFLGPFQASVNIHRMNALGITHVLCIRDRREASMIFPRFPTEFKYLTLDISDTTDQNIISIFPQCKAFIEEGLNQGGRVLAHCNGGIATAPAIVIGYLMWKYNWKFEYTLAYVQSKRYCVSPMSFQTQLKEYEPIYLAQKMLEAERGSNASSFQSPLKRSHLDDEEDDYQRRRPAPSTSSMMSI
ncbi:phosphatases II [Kockovaella imperatae]|uniref:Phosphatases II n=1 Tax=Kockovaella imperatae TaxID=4999 RepID=A0A1Y1UFA2_9TREE|nr:phosphatases II [Kockovaella imperatae]ORX36740.1 phosphatases II [Kockovaella imperatae]